VQIEVTSFGKCKYSSLCDSVIVPSSVNAALFQWFLQLGKKIKKISNLSLTLILSFLSLSGCGYDVFPPFFESVVPPLV
jgi:hypothetical protein